MLNDWRNALPAARAVSARWAYDEPLFDERGSIVGTVTWFMSDDDIVRQYMPSWAMQMQKVGKSDLVTRENCIADFVVVNWAYAVKA